MAGRPKGLPKTGGRQKGVGNRVGADVRELARQYTTQAIEVLVAIMLNPNHTSQAMAANSLLDRGWGKAPQALTGADGEGPVIVKIIKQGTE